MTIVIKYMVTHTQATSNIILAVTDSQRYQEMTSYSRSVSSLWLEHTPHY